MTAVRAYARSPLPWLAGLLALYLLSPIGDFLGRLATTHRLSSPGTGSALVVSAETATIATTVIAALGVPLAYLLARGRSRRSALVGIAVQLPIALPPLIGGILLLYLVGPYSFIGTIFGGRLTDNRAGIVLAQIFVAAPFLIVSARSAFAAIDPAFDDVAATLGHRPFARFAKLAVPTALPGILAGLMLAWLRGFGEFGATVILAYHPYSLPVFTYVQFGSTGLSATMLPTAAALGTALLVLLAAAAAGRVQLANRRRPIRRRQTMVAADRPTVAPTPLAFDVRATAGAFTVRVAATTGRCLALLGATGAGKTLTLRALAGVHPDSATMIQLGNRDLSDLPAERRRVGYLPQESCLLPHLRVLDQACFATGADRALAGFWLTRLGIGELADRWPADLSGGQRRRVALARALAAKPDLLLLDEPFTGLDTPTRADLRRTLRELLRQTPITTVLVTHDPEDVAMLADDVAVLDRGVTLQSGPRMEVYRGPANVRVARLLGIPNALTVTVTGRGRVQASDGTRFTADATGTPVGTEAVAIVDPQLIRIGAPGLSATVLDVVDLAAYRLIELQLGADTSLVAHLPHTAALTELSSGEQVTIAVPRSAVRVSASC